jgi:hypothetical protein
VDVTKDAACKFGDSTTIHDASALARRTWAMSGSAASKFSIQPSVLAPHSSTLLNAAKITPPRVSETSESESFLVSAGPALPDFFGCNGPAEIVHYNCDCLCTMGCLE